MRNACPPRARIPHDLLTSRDRGEEPEEWKQPQENTMNRLSKLLIAVLTVAGLTMATEAQAKPVQHHAHHHGSHHHNHHHHHGAWHWRGGRWVYLNVAGPTYSVFYRSGAATPWALYAPYGSADDAQREADDLQSQGYQAYVQ
jgi:hypothetical protein